MEKIRSFMCFEIKDQAILDKIVNLQETFKYADIKFVERENIHFTLKFFGDITTKMKDKIIQIMEKVAGKPFKIQIEHVGVFPKIQFPRVIWVGVTEGTKEMTEIFQQLNPHFIELGFKKDKRFSSHATIGRVRSGRNKAELINKLREYKDFKIGTMEIKSFQFKKSILTKKGPIYTTLKEKLL